MKEYIPLLQALVWPLFVAGVIFWARTQLGGILSAIKARIDSGDAFEAGTSGVKLTPRAAPLITKDPAKASTPPPNPGYYIAHTTRRQRSMDRGENEFYRITVFLEADPGVPLENVSKVVYHLHETFRDPDREVTDSDTSFQFVTYGWGQFNLRAEVYIKGQSEPLLLQRYLNF